jgi:hypothetical protein
MVARNISQKVMLFVHIFPVLNNQHIINDPEKIGRHHIL